MKKVITIIAILATSVVFAQTFTVKIPSNNYHIGFGHSTEINEMLTLVVNGPLYHDENTLTGGYVDSRKQIKPFVDPSLEEANFKGENTIYGYLDNGIFGLTTDSTMVMIPYHKWDNSIKLVWGFQNGRMLVLDGRNIHNSN